MKFTRLMLKVAKWKLERGDKKAHENALLPNLETAKLDISPFEGASFNQCFDIYYADKPNGITILDIHGGAYIYSSRRNNRYFAKVFNDRGFHVVTLDYRLNHGHISCYDQIRDIAKEIAYLFRHAEELGIDPNKVVLTGDSAGGHFALLLAEASCDKNVAENLGIDFKGVDIKCVAVNCPVYDLLGIGRSNMLTKAAKKYMFGPTALDYDAQIYADPKTNVESLNIPVFASTCIKDFIRNESLMLYEELQKRGKNPIFLDIKDETVGHVHNVTNPYHKASMEVNDAMVNFFLKHIQ